MSVNLVIKMVSSGGTEVPISASLTSTIAELKEQIATPAGLPTQNLRLVCAGKIWQDAATVASYEPRDGAIVHCLNNPPRAVPAASEQTLSSVNPMQAMMQAAGPPPAAAAGDPFSQMMAQSHQMMTQNPEMMQQMMESPMVQQMMSDPQMLRSMMSMNPQMTQLMEQRPEIARLLEDPEVLQQSMQMMRNPSLMREMQRNSDRAIGQLDVMPGGHNALVRAHEDVVDPLMSALSGSGQGTATDVDMAAYAQQAEGLPNSAALPNPWGAPAAAPTPLPAPAAAAAAPAPTFPMFGLQPQTPVASQSNPMAAQSNPMAAMMQQMMSNPAMMQQSMQMAQNMGGQQGAGSVPPASVPPAPLAGGSADPMAAMMQQMMSNPALMQQSMQMAQNMFGNQGMGAGFPGMMGAPPAGAGFPGMMGALPAGGAQAPSATPPSVDSFTRIQFAAQLAQLSAMGFSNEAAALRALQQHQGRVDAAIDMLLAEGCS